MLTTFTLNCGNLKIAQNKVGPAHTSEVRISADFHRLTPEQFDALIEQFTVTEEARTLTTNGKYGAPKTFRTAEIDFGGLTMRLFADVPVEEFTAIEAN